LAPLAVPVVRPNTTVRYVPLVAVVKRRRSRRATGTLAATVAVIAVVVSQSGASSTVSAIVASVYDGDTLTLTNDQRVPCCRSTRRNSGRASATRGPRAPRFCPLRQSDRVSSLNRIRRLTRLTDTGGCFATSDAAA
jgi:hypothetical protein